MIARMDSKLKVAVWRGKEEGAFIHYEVPRQASQTVLDVVTHIQRHLDSTLAYRFACRVGMCGSCAMTVNGKARWTCRTRVEAVAAAGALEIAPLAHFPVIRDLVTDMRGFFDRRRARALSASDITSFKANRSSGEAPHGSSIKSASSAA